MNDNWVRGRGGGFINDDGSKAMTRCPECGRENYCMSVTAGVCAFCGCDENANDDAELSSTRAAAAEAARAAGGGK